MSTAATVQEVNRELARQINQEARTNPQSPYANKFVGIANGKVVVADDLPSLFLIGESQCGHCVCVESRCKVS